MSKKGKIIQAGIIFLLALLLISVTLFSGENVVLSNNGDFGRVARLCSLAIDAEGSMTISQTDKGFWSGLGAILFTPGDVSTYPSCQLVFVRLSVAANYLTNAVFNLPADGYNIFFLGVMMSVLYALSLTFLLTQLPVKNKYLYWGAVCLSLFVLCDIGYVSYFNSLYAEGLQQILLVGLAGFLLLIAKRPFKLWETLLFVLSLVFYGQAKFFNVPLAILIGIGFFMLALRRDRTKKTVVISGGAVILSTAVLLLTMQAMPGWIQKETNYNAVFYGIVKDVDDSLAKTYLEKDLGLDPDLYVLKNTHHYVSNFSEIQETYDITGAEGISKIKLLSFYIKHPGETLAKFPVIARHSGVLRNIFFMDNDYMQNGLRCSLWSQVRENIGFDTLWLNGLVVLLMLFCLIYWLKKSTLPAYMKIAFPVLLVCAYGYSFIVPYISNGEADLAKHMYLFCELIDLSLIALLCGALSGRKKQKILSLALVVVIAVLALLPLKSCKTLTFGGYEWNVIEENDAYKTLIAKDAVATRSYHVLPENDYAASDIHAWLNNEFLETFSEDEKERLYVREEAIPVSVGNIGLATAGNRDFYCSPFPALARANYDSAYTKRVSGAVFLPTVAHISTMAKNGYQTAMRDKYWLSTPYFNHDGKCRYVSPDGFIYFEYVTEEMGIRPILYIKNQR